MEEKAKLMMDYNREAFETYFNSILMLQGQVSTGLDNMLSQVFWLQGQAKSFIDEWIAVYKKGAFDFKRYADNDYSKVKEALTDGMKSSKQRSKKKAKDKYV